MCFKKRYNTAGQARRTLSVLRLRKMRKDRALNVYRCAECRNAGAVWHIGHGAAA